MLQNNGMALEIIVDGFYKYDEAPSFVLPNKASNEVSFNFLNDLFYC